MANENNLILLRNEQREALKYPLYEWQAYIMLTSNRNKHIFELKEKIIKNAFNHKKIA